MNTFDKLCALLAIPVGYFFMIKGIAALFVAVFMEGYLYVRIDLHWVLALIMFLVGWAMCITLIRVWRRQPPRSTERDHRDDPREPF